MQMKYFRTIDKQEEWLEKASSQRIREAAIISRFHLEVRFARKIMFHNFNDFCEIVKC